MYDLDNGTPVASAVLDVWQAATNGLYENQDENQPDYNLRGQFRTDEAGDFELVALMPTPYPVPTDGPVGELLRIAKRSVFRHAHIHFIVSAPGYETLITQVFVDGDELIDLDVVFTASDNMIGKLQRIDTENEMVRHFLEGQLFPGNHPDTLERKYRFFDDKLSLKPWDGTDREILWQRAANA